VSLDVIQRDEDVDRLTLLISRQFTEILRSGPLKVADLDSVMAFNYMQVALNLERIADHASRIAWISMDLSGPFTALNPDQEALLDLEPALRRLIEKSISSLLLADAERANQVIEKTGDILKAVNFTVVSPGIRGADDGLAWLTAASSLERITDYIMNIGELTINLAYPLSQRYLE
jgi:phosphate uptake regulator